mgnify:CR=1 FL=1
MIIQFGMSIKWKKIARNFEKVKHIPNIKLDVCITVQSYNILHMDKLLNWVLDQNLPNTMIFFNILEEPSHLNIKAMPLHLKQLASSRLQPYLHLPKLSNAIDYMMIEQTDGWDTFIIYTKKLLSFDISTSTATHHVFYSLPRCQVSEYAIVI